jgi:hypothetical protein
MGKPATFTKGEGDTLALETVDPAAVDLGKGWFWLDADATGVRSRYVRGSRRALDNACADLIAAGEGQIGVYRSCTGSDFFGYVIKYPDQAPVFERAAE